MLEDTLIIVTSDNRARGRTGKGTSKEFPPGSVFTFYDHKMSGDWRGFKGKLWEGGHRVPFIASWPEHINFGVIADQLIVLDDLMAIFAAILGVRLPPHSAKDSYNILHYLESAHTGSSIREYVVFRTCNGDHFLRGDQWVLAPFLYSGGPFAINRDPKPAAARKGSSTI